jgi:hypothetical protein
MYLLNFLCSGDCRSSYYCASYRVGQHRGLLSTGKIETVIDFLKINALPGLAFLASRLWT